MNFDFRKTEDQTKASIYLCKLVDNKSKCELKKLSDSRSAKQNRSLHKFFTIISEQLNELGLEFQFFGLKGEVIGTPYTPTIVKERFWRQIQVALFDIESTKDINTQQINDIIDVITKFFSDKGVVIAFPSIETLMNND